MPPKGRQKGAKRKRFVSNLAPFIYDAPAPDAVPPEYLKKGAHTTVPQQTADAGPWVACLAPACSPGQGTPCPWLAELSDLAT
ncbi:hypothetical protein HaLaN_26797, partial [Haematococcus lacustris]